MKNSDGAIDYAQRALDFSGEVDVTRRVDDVDPAVAPEARGGRRRDRDATLLFLLHPVHDGGALLDLADLVRHLGVDDEPRGGVRVPVGYVSRDARLSAL